MAERHTVDFDQGAFNDHERRLVTLQLERGVCTCDSAFMDWSSVPARKGPVAPLRDGFGCGLHPSPRFAGWVLKPVRRRFGDRPVHRLLRWLLRQGASPLVPARRLRPHPDNPDVVCWDLALREGRRPEEALGSLLDFLRGLPGYRRTVGPPLDPDEAFDAIPPASAADASAAAWEVMRRWIEMSKYRGCVEEGACDDVAPAEPDALPAADAVDPGASASPT